jgi:tripartite-type tricarboxylate transporter receptor subunit TctC
MAKSATVTRRRALLAAAAPAFLASPRGAAAQDFANRPVSIVVASPAGGGTDFSARLVSEGLAQMLTNSNFFMRCPARPAHRLGMKMGLR